MKRITLIGILIAVGLFLVPWGSTEPTTYQEKKAARQTYEVPAQAATLVRDLGLDMNLVQYMKIELPQDASVCSGNSAATAACFGNGTLIYPQTMFNTRSDQQLALFGHEYLHFVWGEITESERQNLRPALDWTVVNVPNFNKRLDSYQNLSEADRYNELQAYACTEITGWKLPENLRAYCVKYIPNRSVLPSYY